MQKRWKLFLAAMVPVALGAALLAGYLADPAAASGIPKTDPLFYSGLLTDKSGTPMSGSPNVGVSLYASASGGKPVCYTTTVNCTQRVPVRVPYTVTRCVRKVVCTQVPVTVCCPAPCCCN